MVEPLSRMLLPLSALPKVLLRRSQLLKVRPKLKEPVVGKLDVGVATSAIPLSQTDPCGICKQLGHWAKEYDQRKKPATENVDVKGDSCPLVSPTWIYVT